MQFMCQRIADTYFVRLGCFTRWQPMICLSLSLSLTEHASRHCLSDFPPAKLASVICTSHTSAGSSAWILGKSELDTNGIMPCLLRGGPLEVRFA